jgi:hypothetical protein
MMSTLLLLLSPALEVSADDASRGVALPAPIALTAGALRVDSSFISVSTESIAIRMKMQVPDAKGATLELLLPRFGWMGEAEPYPDRNFPELRFLLDGKAATVQDGFRAFVGKEEITRVLEQDKLDPFVIADTPPFLAWKSGASHSVSDLQATGAIESVDDRYVANWEAQRIITLHLANGAHELEITYKPRPAYWLSPIQGLTHSRHLKEGCVSGADLAAAFGEPGTMVMAREYTVPTATEKERALAIEAQVNLSKAEVGKPNFLAFCGKDNKAMTSTTGRALGPSQPDSEGDLHVLIFERVAY